MNEYERRMNMVKDILFEKDVVTTTHFVFRGISTEFMTYRRYKITREMSNLSIQTYCFICEEQFVEDENLSFLFDGNELNKLCCEKCSEALINEN